MLVENLASLGRAKRNATSVSLIVIAAFAMYNWAVRPQAASLSSAKAYESLAEEHAKESRDVVTKVDTRRKMLMRLSEESDHLLDVLFTSEQAGEFFSDLQAASELAGCAVHAINMISEGQKSEHQRLGIRIRSVELNVVGMYRDIATLIGRLQTRSQRVWLDSLEIQSMDYSSDTVGCRLLITICEIVDKDTS